jgi:hypothetical protein
MVLRWWRYKHPFEEWRLCALRPDGTWYEIAVAHEVYEGGWWAGKIERYSHGWQGVPHGGRKKFDHRKEAFLAAEGLVPEYTKGHGFIRHWVKPAIYVSGWLYPPRIKRGRQKSRGTAPMIEVMCAGLARSKPANIGT